MYTKRMTRIDFNAGALLKYKGVVYKGTIENMSLNGICIVLEQSNNEIAINEKVEVEITVEEGENRKTIELMCIVIRRDTSRYGLKFDTVDVDSWMQIRDIIISGCQDEKKILDELFDFALGKD